MKRNFNISNVLILIACLFCVTLGCTGYGKVSDRTYELAKALYSICNAKDEQRLAKIRTMISDEKSGVAMTSREIDWLEDIVEQAAAGKWESAAAKARQLMEDQAVPTGG